MLSDQSVTAYVISLDEKDVAFTTMDSTGESQISLAPLDRRTPLRVIARACDQLSFGAAGELILRSLEDGFLTGPVVSGKQYLLWIYSASVTFRRVSLHCARGVRIDAHVTTYATHVTAASPGDAQMR